MKQVLDIGVAGSARMEYFKHTGAGVRFLNAIEAKGLTKHYRVYRRPFDRLKEALTRRSAHDTVIALDNVSFDVQLGGTLGIIGENGAGKSTLLKILAGTVQPTFGTFQKTGRISALLELGSGFHPEFSGRQNIYLNAALLGLQEKEIRALEPAIIDFCGLESAIDRPVKTYSSGMYVRLAFSIATSVNPDILIIDEALSVGDQGFQQKCIERMMGFRKAQKTIIICSHSMYLINELCDHVLWLKNGRKHRMGNAADIAGEYLAYQESEDKSHVLSDNTVSFRPRDVSTAAPEIRIEDVSLFDKNKRPAEKIQQFQELSVRVRTKTAGKAVPGHLAIGFGLNDEQQIFETTTKLSGLDQILFTGEQETELVIPSIPIQGGNYWVKVRVGDEYAIRVIDQMTVGPFLIRGEHPEIGVVWIPHQWRTLPKGVSNPV